MSTYPQKSQTQFSYSDIPSETIYILDGTSILYQSYHSSAKSGFHSRHALTKAASTIAIARAKSRNNGTLLEGSEVDLVHCGALIQMADHLVRFVRKIKPRYLAVAFDAGETTFRHDLYSEYKAKRSPVRYNIM